jgi:hypothetical protein
MDYKRDNAKRKDIIAVRKAITQIIDAAEMLKDKLYDLEMTLLDQEEEAWNKVTLSLKNKLLNSHNR